MAIYSSLRYASSSSNLAYSRASHTNARSSSSSNGSSTTTKTQSQTSTTKKTQSEAEQLFNQLRSKLNSSPWDALREKVIKSLGLTEEKIASLPTKEKDATEIKVAQLMKDELFGTQNQNTSTNSRTAHAIGLYRMLSLMTT